ncbi:carboxymethylenebutenolidase [Sphingomonas vulcanisoli]|uniref:Carboxymethylenebutenolidase n=1 Tax=Sphingomonas vulcanisoli TaxID=1658060 RepID=A0ABX0TTF5_9SPHN|nr:dienelactone hydrolase family protein [Sphingomonas vulcanisoli]NIJ08799.1 carboxymethylenebutenolidase [Sphingomonas vulcanisoli]
MTHETLDIKTNDGTCPAHVFAPDGTGPWPGAIIYTDILGMRPATIEFAERLASYGYVVLLPDLFYRRGPYAPIDPKPAFASGNFAEVAAPMRAAVNKQQAADDTLFYLDALTARADVKPGKIGVTGYCFGGGVAIVAAGTYPDRIGAAGAFHAGNLATDDADSPHLLLPRIDAELYVGAAEKDHSYPFEMQERFKQAADAAGVTYTHELYEGAGHGWTQTDFPIYNKEADDRHWRELIALFKRTIG